MRFGLSPANYWANTDSEADSSISETEAMALPKISTSTPRRTTFTKTANRSFGVKLSPPSSSKRSTGWPSLTTPTPKTHSHRAVPTPIPIMASHNSTRHSPGIRMPDSDSDESSLSANSSDELASDSSDEAGSYNEDDATKFDLGTDSEEDEWPVRPGVETKRFPVSPLDPRKARRIEQPTWTSQNWDRRDREQRQRAWNIANARFAASLPLSGTLPSMTDERRRDINGEIENVTNMLRGLETERARKQDAQKRSWEERNKALWESIEASISAFSEQAEKEEAEEAARTTRLQAENAKKQKDAEIRARKAREEAELQQRQERDARDRRERDERVREDAAKTSGESREEWQRWNQVMRRVKTEVLPAVSNNEAWRKMCWKARREITPKVGMLTNSREQVLRITVHFHHLLTSALQVGTPCYLWCLNHLSKSLLKQAETEITAKQSVAYPLGRVVTALLLAGHKELGDILMARLAKKCFWTVGYYPPKQEGQSSAEHEKTLGHLSTPETMVQYSTRMSGIIALYSAVIQASPLSLPTGPQRSEDPANIPPQFRLSALWKLLIRVTAPPLSTLEPAPQVAATILEISGFALLQAYGRQFQKFLECLWRDGIKGGKCHFSNQSKSSIVRLELTLEECITKGTIAGTEGRECELP